MFERLGERCQFVPGSNPAVSRHVSIYRASVPNDEFISEPIRVAEFLKSEGDVQEGDVFEIRGMWFSIRQLHSEDSVTSAWIYS